MHGPPTSLARHDEASDAPAAPSTQTLEKLSRLHSLIQTRKGVVVAYSGGVDSTLIAAAATQAVGPYQGTPGTGALAVIANSTTLARRELHLARATADQIHLPLVEIEYSELDDPEWTRNAGDRCYHCKADLSTRVAPVAKQHGYRQEQIAYGTTTSDLGDHRPGIQAIEESQGWQPLLEAGLSKPEVRTLARHLGLPVWDKPATPCLASRVQYGERITEATLRRIEQAEDALHNMGFPVLRVRHHDRLARLEVPVERLEEALSRRDEIVRVLRAAGYVYATLDLMGHRSGAMNEAL